MSKIGSREALLIAWDWLGTAERLHPKPTHPPTQPQTLNLIQSAKRDAAKALDLLRQEKECDG